MTFDEYQQFTESTAVYPKENGLLYVVLGLCGEAGEIAEKVKKVLRDDNAEFTPEKKWEIAMEIGDVFWYCNRLVDELGFDMSEIVEENIKKLNSRKERNVLGGSGDNR